MVEDEDKIADLNSADETDSTQNENFAPSPEEMSGDEPLAAGTTEAAQKIGTNEYFRNMVDRNFLEYAAYAIKDRAIPNVDDGLKPVQRRILWAMHKTDENRTVKASFIVGEVMGKYHPHGDASIKDALVVLANKEYFIEKQGNFGNILTGSCAAAPRYIECGLNSLSREVLFNDEITEMVSTYDGRNQEPVVLPVKIPSLLMLGSEGIAVGMATKIMPHNFNELLQAQISELRGGEFELYPDFQQGGLMDVREYNDGNGKITLRAKIEIVDRKLIIRELPATTTTESLIASIEKAAERGKIKISSVNDYTSKNVEIEIVPMRGYDPEKALQALYMYTDCSVSISPNLTVIRDFRPAVMSVTEVIKRNTAKMLEYLRLELENALQRQNELFHAKTLAQLFFENRIYKRIEELEDEAAVYAEVRSGLAPFMNMLRREVTNEDIDKLLALPVRRIAKFDIEKNQRELREIDRKIKEIKHKLKHLVDCAVEYLENLIKKYGHMFPRRTEIEYLDKIDRQVAALNNVKVGWDRKNGYIGSSVKSDDSVTCNEFDLLLCMERSGKYKIISIPDKIFIGRLYEFRKYDPAQEFGIVYRENKSGKYYAKRSVIDKFIKDREYNLIPENCRLELFTPRCDAIYDFIPEHGGAKKAFQLNIMEFQLRSAKARGLLIFGKALAKIAFFRYLEGDELSAILVEAEAKNNNFNGNEKEDDGENPGDKENIEAGNNDDDETDDEENIDLNGGNPAPDFAESSTSGAPVLENLADDMIERGELPAVEAEEGKASEDLSGMSACGDDEVVACEEKNQAAKSVTHKSAAEVDPPKYELADTADTAGQPDAHMAEELSHTPRGGSKDNLFGSLLDDIPVGDESDKPANKKRKGRSVKRDKDNDKPEGGDDDSWGIIQPELFGF